MHRMGYKEYNGQKRQKPTNPCTRRVGGVVFFLSPLRVAGGELGCPGPRWRPAGAGRHRSPGGAPRPAAAALVAAASAVVIKRGQLLPLLDPPLAPRGASLEVPRLTPWRGHEGMRSTKPAAGGVGIPPVRELAESGARGSGRDSDWRPADGGGGRPAAAAAVRVGVDHRGRSGRNHRVAAGEGAGRVPRRARTSRMPSPVRARRAPPGVTDLLKT